MKSKKETLFEEYLIDAGIFVVDNSTASRSRLAKIFVDLGATTNNITTFAKYEQAEHAMNIKVPKIVISDYDLGKKSGFDLLQIHRENNPDTKNSLFVLVTSDSSQSLVAQAAEEDIDSFVLKPYTLDKIRKVLLESFMNKIHPNDYIKAIEEGKELLFNGKAKESLDIFDKAKKLNSKPTLAFFYYGQAEMMMMATEAAENSYNSCLTFNKIHYKCLCSLYDLLFKMKRYHEAYDVVRTLADYFPANPKRLASVLHLALKTQNYHDIEGYYQKFLDLEVRSEEITSAVSAALTICGRYYLQKNKKDRAITLFEKVGLSTQNPSKFLRIIIEYLVIYNLQEKLKDIFKKFPLDQKTSDDYKIANFLVEQISLKPQDRIRTAMDFIRMEVFNYAIYYVLIENLAESKRFEEAQKYADEAIIKWSDERSTFSKIIQKYQDNLILTK